MYDPYPFPQDMNSALQEDPEFFKVFLAFFASFYLIFALVALTLGIVAVISQWKLYKKAGEAGWKCIVPFYNEWIRIKIALGRTSIGWFILSLIPFLSLIEYWYVGFYFGKRFSGKDSMAFCYMSVPFVVGILMAFSNRYQYIANRDATDSGRGGIDGDFPLWAEEGVMVPPQTFARYDSRFSDRNSTYRHPDENPNEANPNEANPNAYDPNGPQDPSQF